MIIRNKTKFWYKPQKKVSLFIERLKENSRKISVKFGCPFGKCSFEKMFKDKGGEFKNVLVKKICSYASNNNI